MVSCSVEAVMRFYKGDKNITKNIVSIGVFAFYNREDVAP